MPQETIVDSSFAIALLDRDDRHHRAAVAAAERIVEPIVTNVAVLVEASHMLDFSTQAQLKLIELARTSMTVDSETEVDLERIAVLMEKYADLPADFTDASLVALAERRDTTRVATFDSDFDVYRFRGRRKFEIVPGL